MSQSQSYDTQALPKVSVVMPVYNEEKTVSEALMSVLKQDYPPDLVEILVVDGCSEDRTCDIVSEMIKSNPRVRLLQNERRIVSSGRNVGIRASSGEWIFIVDGHSFIGKNYISLAVHLAQKSGALCLARPQPLYIRRNAYLARAIAVARESRLGGSVTTHRNSDEDGWVDPTSVAVIYHRSLFERFGLFDERFETNEDVEFNWRLYHAGVQAYFSSGLRCHYHPRSNLLGLRRQMFRYGFYRMQFLKKHKSAFHWSYVIPVVFLLSQIALVLGKPFAPHIARQALVTELSMYGTALLLGSLQAARSRGWRYMPIIPLAYVVIHCGVGGGFIWGSVMPLGKAINIDVAPSREDDGAVNCAAQAVQQESAVELDAEE